MFTPGASVTRKSGRISSPMARSLVVLQSMASRAEFQIPTWKLSSRQHSLSQSAQALSRYYRKMSMVKREGGFHDSEKQNSSFLAQVDKLQKAFLKRPGCPQLNTRATSMAHCGLPTSMNLPETGITSESLSKIKDLDYCEKVQRMESVEPLLPRSKSACEFRYLRRSSSVSLSPVASGLELERKAPHKKMPWYIAVINEKEHCLLMLEEELQRLSRLDVQLQRKDLELLELREKQELLRTQLRCLTQGRGPEGSPQSTMQEDDSSSLRDQDDRDLELEVAIFKEEEVLEEGPGLEGGSRSSSVLEQEDMPDEEEYQVLELELSEDEDEEEEEERELRDTRPSLHLNAAFQEELMNQLQEMERLMQDFQMELEVTRNSYSMATGAITTLLRQVEYQDAQLRKGNTEKEKLKKELQDRKHQLLAMSDKFSKLREEKKQVELLGQMEKENLLLRQQVSVLEESLVDRDQIISELNAQVTGLQVEVEEQRGHLQRWKKQQEVVQSKVEAVQQEELLTRAALEATQARLDRLRSRIMQTTFNSNNNLNNKPIISEITDSDILEALQLTSDAMDHGGIYEPPGKPFAVHTCLCVPSVSPGTSTQMRNTQTIINEKSEHSGQLKPKSKVPPVVQSESMIKTRKLPSK